MARSAPAGSASQNGDEGGCGQRHQRSERQSLVVGRRGVETDWLPCMVSHGGIGELSHQCEDQARRSEGEMRIGELSDRTGTSRRLLRYYDKQGLIAPGRSSNGYRVYDEDNVDRVMQIRGLLEAGSPTKIIKQIMSCLGKPGTIYFPDATPEMLATLELERDRMTERAQCLIRNRDAIAAYLDAVRGDVRQGAA